jgi:hypothetical protein
MIIICFKNNTFSLTTELLVNSLETSRDTGETESVYA